MSNSLRTHGHQASLSMGFSRQEYWRGLPFPSPGNFHSCPLPRGYLLPSTTAEGAREQSPPSKVEPQLLQNRADASSPGSPVCTPGCPLAPPHPRPDSSSSSALSPAKQWWQYPWSYLPSGPAGKTGTQTLRTLPTLPASAVLSALPAERKCKVKARWRCQKTALHVSSGTFVFHEASFSHFLTEARGFPARMSSSIRAVKPQTIGEQAGF